jgi:hypothetical protein
MPLITKKILVDDLGDTPAMTHRPTGTMFIARKWLYRLSPEQWKFIEKHEEAHSKFDSTDEFFADDYASREYLKNGGSPYQSVAALANGLPFKTPDHHARLLAQVVRAAKYDCEKNNHEPACKLYRKMTIAGATTIAFHGFGIADAMKKNFSGMTGNVSVVDFSNVADLDALKAVMTAEAPNMSGLTNCSKYILPSRRRDCEADNQAERDAEADKLNKQIAAEMQQAQLKLEQTKLSTQALTQPDMQQAQLQYQLEIEKLKQQRNSGNSKTILGMDTTTAAIAAAAVLLILVVVAFSD